MRCCGKADGKMAYAPKEVKLVPGATKLKEAGNDLFKQKARPMLPSPSPRASRSASPLHYTSPRSATALH